MLTNDIKLMKNKEVISKFDFYIDHRLVRIKIDKKYFRHTKINIGSKTSDTRNNITGNIALLELLYRNIEEITHLLATTDTQQKYDLLKEAIKSCNKPHNAPNKKTKKLSAETPELLK